MKYTKLGLLTLITILIASCKNNSDENKFEKIGKMDWLIGEWENKMPEGLLMEVWTKDNDSTFSGNSYFIKEEDTTHFESIVLIEVKDEIIYRPTVKGQNNDEPVDFKLTSDVENSFTFENPKHDYPQKVTYKKVNEKSLVATISGIQQGKQSSESYPMTKK